MTEKVEININTRPQIHPLKLMIMPAVQLVLIGIGVVVDSAAMQWLGFVMFWILLLTVNIVKVKQDSGLTVEQAKQRIEEIEKNQVKV